MPRNESKTRGQVKKAMTATSVLPSQEQDKRSLGLPPMSSVFFGHGRLDSMSTLESFVHGTTASGSSSPGISRSGSTSQLNAPIIRPDDKTVCEYCGVSYMTMSAMRSLQAKVKDQGKRLSQLNEAAAENNRMKETLGNIRKNHHKEVTKRDEECQRWVIRCTTVENEVENLKRDLKDCQVRNADLAQKYAIASEDFKQQEELISQLRSKLQLEGDMEAENIALIHKNKNLEDNLQKLLQELKSLRTSGATPSTMKGHGHVAANDETAGLKAQITELAERCNRLTAENALYQEELLAVLQSQEKQEKQFCSSSSHAAGDQTKHPSKIPSVVSVEVHDLKRENTILQSRLQAINQEHSNCQDMHAFLRESIEKLKSDNARLVEEMNGLKVKFQENLLKVENFQVVISGYQAERNRFMASYKDQQNKLEQLAAQNRAFHKSCNPKLIEQLRANVSSLERQIQGMHQEKDREQLEFEAKLAEVQREVIMEKEKMDSCLTHSIFQREDVERRWQERWTRHHNKLTGQLEILKTNYEGSLKCAKDREEALQREISFVEEKLAQTQKAWDDYKVQMNEELFQWKVKYDELEDEFQHTVKGKVDVEVMFQQKTQQLEELHEAVRQGCEERHDLQRRAEELERSIQEAACTDISTAATSLTPCSTVLMFPNSMENHSSINAQDSCSIIDASSVPLTTNAVASWKQCQNYTPPKNQSQQQQRQAKTGGGSSLNESNVRRRPSSPFPLLGGKKSPQTFMVGLGKNAKTSSTGNLKGKSSPMSSKTSSGVVFSVAPPPNPTNPNNRKAQHRQH